MGKRQLSVDEAFDLRQSLHVAVLEALMASRRWQPGDLIFQGGTSLHLAHGSPRYSEDLDFLVKSSLKLASVSEAMQARLASMPWVPLDMALSVSAPKPNKNPHTFDVSLLGPSVVGAVRVKVELWQAPTDAMQPLAVVVAPVRLIVGPAAGAQAFVPTLSQQEIFVDKVFAVAARRYLKPRDVFDLWWLQQQRGDALTCSPADLQLRLATYPNETAGAWLAKAHDRRAELMSSAPKVAEDLRRWLPSSWPLADTDVNAMIAASVAALDRGVNAMIEMTGNQQGAAKHGADSAEYQVGEDLPRP